jgi:molybdopterin-containing oxidoreductase family iron-sulfur binding subunit
MAYWRSLEELADSPQVRELIEQEFPHYDAGAIVNSSRRRFLKLMGASMALAGLTLTGCRRWPKEKLAPHTSTPQNRIPGVPEQYATVWEVGGVARPLLVTSFDGRPIKIEGNPTHPWSWTVKDKIGSADAFAQASILEMYDPQRSRTVIDRSKGEGKESTWDAFTETAVVHFARLREKSEGFAVLSESSGSPSVQDMKARLLAVFPQARWYEYEALSRDNEIAGAVAAFGKALRPVVHFDKASVAVLLDADLLGTHPAHVRYAADWAARRREGEKGSMNRVYMAESAFTITGSVADERLAIDPSRIEVVARAIAEGMAILGAGVNKLDGIEAKFVAAVVGDLKKYSGAGVVLAGASASPATHAICHAINERLGAVGKTITFIDEPSPMNGMVELTKAMSEGTVKTLLILGGNPVFDAPVDLEFAENLKKVETTIRLGLYDDETSKACKWHLPRAHYLESWGDARAWDGTVGVQQPLIEPLFGGKSIIEVLSIISGDKLTAGEAIVQRTWREKFLTGGDFEKTWRTVLEAGVLANSASAAVNAVVTMKEFPSATAEAPKGRFVRFQEDSHVYDGRFANNGWLQEMGDPLTKLTWDNAALLSVKDAKELGLTTGDVVRIEANGRMLETAVYVLPGQPIGAIGLTLGYGRRAGGSIGEKLGFNTYSLRTSNAMYSGPVAKITPLGKTYTLA